MKLTKIKQKQLDEAYDVLIQVCLYDRPLLDMEPYLADDVMNFGAGNKEITKTKTAFLKQIKNQKKLAAGLKMDFKIKPVLRKIINEGTGAIYTDDIVNTVWINGVQNKLRFRLSFIFEYRQHKWFMVHSHTSTPDPQRSDDEVWPVEELKKRTAVLEKSLDEKIAELESKNRELEIEAALERVRSRSLAMHKSDELLDVVQSVFERLHELNIEFYTAVIIIFNEGSRDVEWWLVNKLHQQYSRISVKYADLSYFRDLFEAKETGMELFSACYSGKEKEEFYDYLFEQPGFTHIPEEQKGFLKGSEFATMCVALSRNTAIHLTRYSNNLFAKKEKEILKRFAKVFEQSYTRFLDLQKAEAQARESQIQLALERVRARTMAMQHSDELADAASLLFKQINDLGIQTWTSGFNIWQEEDTSFIGYNPTPTGGSADPYVIPSTEDNFFITIYQAKKRGEDFLVFESEGESLAQTYRYMKTLPVVKDVLKGIEYSGFQLPIFQINHCVFFAQGFLLFITLEPYPKAHDIFKKFGKVFQQTYTRFLDLQKAEAQAREAQIELGLERVRARAMAMQKSSELAELIDTLQKELSRLEFTLNNCIFWIMTEEPPSATWWIAPVNKTSLPESFPVPFPDLPYFNAVLKAWKERIPKWVYELKGKDKYDADQYIFTETNLTQLPPEVKKAFRKVDEVYISFSFYNYGGLHISTNEPLFEEQLEIINRFSRVFDLTYTRFLDLQKAEAQAREARIEAALERVRSRTMAMHKSEELLEVITVVSDQLQHLKLKFNTVSFAINNQDHDYKFWFAVIGNPTPIYIEVPYLDNPMFNRVKEVLAKGISFYADTLSPEESRQWHEHVFARTDLSFMSEETKAYVLRSGYARSIAIMPSIMLIISNYAAQAYADEENDIIRRFAAVFEQAYTRFLDLQRAEAQARESQIQLALERVRARTMAMQNQNELIDLITLLSEQLQSLGCRIDNATFSNGLCEKDWDIWVANPSLKMPAHRLFIPWLNHPYFLKTAEGLKNHKQTGQDLNVALFTKDEKDSFLDHLFSNTTYKDSPTETRQFLYDQPAFTFSAIFLKETWVSIGKYVLEPYTEEENGMLRRFALAFGQAYTRFLDLRKAETQAREATIEAALERVRGKAMAMHNSDDLPSTASTVFSELKKLGLNSIRNGVGLLSKQNRKVILYSTTSSEEGEHLSMVGSIMLQDHPVLTEIYASWLNRNDYFPVLQEEELKSYHEKVLSAFALAGSSYAKNLLLNTRAGENAGYKQYGHFMPFSEGYLFDWSEQPRTEAEIFILKRFVSVIDLTFRRFIELQKSEANAREAVKQAALDRIRADIASMRAVIDLDRITPLIWKELTVLGVTFIRCGVFIMDEAQELIHTFLSTPDGKAVAAFHLPYSTPGKMKVVLTHWQNNSIYADHWEEADFKEMANILVRQNAITTPDEYLGSLPKGGFYLHFIPFLQGMLYVGCLVPLVEDQISLVQSVAEAFSTAYARYEDFNRLEAAKQQVDKTLVELKLAQGQLIQSEKMASLGELTAGIAHEIQNPLNFVNNFSEVNAELIAELNQEVQKGNLDEVRAIAASLRDNEEKINHHGKRADAIVKGMLQHSRINTGQKEPTDFNVLADEYLRLSYHGMRAKNKSFNALLKTDFEKSLGKIPVIPQDIGRALLNLYNNAFYAVMEKSKFNIPGYESAVTVITRKTDKKVEIRITDNGTGIPQEVRDKIFQPFFTTKPTGQGTGLGLSLSYDIVKTHGGELKVETKEGEGSEFIIQLPVV